MKWSFAAGDSILNSPAIGPNGIVYVGSKDDKLYALNGQTGSKVWDLAIGDDISSTPTIGNNGLVYFGSNDRKLRAVNALTGELVWSFEAAGGIVCSPSIDPDGNVFFGCTERIFYSLDAQTGTMIWQFRVGSQANSSAAIGTDGMIYFGSDKLYALDGRNGEKKWEYGSFYIHSSPAIGMDGTVSLAVRIRSFTLWMEKADKRNGASLPDSPITLLLRLELMVRFILDRTIQSSMPWTPRRVPKNGSLLPVVIFGEPWPLEPMAWSVSDPMTIRFMRCGDLLLQIPMAHLRPELDEIGQADTYRFQYVLSLTDGNGSTHNHLFSIDSDDFCVPASYTISNRIPPTVSASG